MRFLSGEVCVRIFGFLGGCLLFFYWLCLSFCCNTCGCVRILFVVRVFQFILQNAASSFVEL
jgi:hypothetical protein